MPNIRIGFASDFTLKGSNIGIGTTTADVKLQVPGTLKGDLSVSGVSTLTTYGGFAAQKQNITKDSSIGFSTTGIGTVGITSFISVNERETGFLSLVGEYNTVSEDLIVDEGKIFEVSTTNITATTTLGTQEVYAPDDSVVSVGTLESVSIQSHFSVPDGGSNDRPDQPTEGMVRFNDDLNTLEFYNGIEWRQFTVSGASGRAVFGGGDYSPGKSANIDTVLIPTQGNTINFGELTIARSNAGTCGDGRRAVFAGGEPNTNRIDYNSIPSGGTGIDFGNLSDNFRYMAGCSSSTRGIYFSGSTPGASNVIEYIEIQTTGNSQDFGDLIGNGILNHGACSSPVRGISMDGQVGGNQQIQYVTIASKGNALSFGSGLDNGGSGAGDAGRSCSNELIGIWEGGGGTNVINYITIATTGNAKDFGDLTVGRYGTATASSKIRGIIMGGYNPAVVSTIDYITFASRGDAIDFGDSGDPRLEAGGTSDSHGGLGGF